MPLMKAEPDMIRVRLEPPLRGRWKGTLDARKISQQKAVVALIERVVTFDPLLQAMLFGQVPETDNGDLAKLVLRRLAASAAKPAQASRGRRDV